ncbi:hypothetical protein PCIT_b1106 [Pseudoalteromonas citrea]|uniref:TonB-dependent receptor n=2 Tax=Pseudoalteromonas citrea TaxID=43655 RepID=A0AAD4FQF5_9GAMM|nr:hypothetical protein [Pseudoalteromonas citrea]KAF7764988.1 hypothetical protein PCIT_b1106 [Pseudoalteromonas citrea]
MNKQLKMLGLACTFSSLTVVAESASDNSSQASKYSVLALGHSSVASAQVASGVLAVPLLVAGSTASASHAAAEVLLDVASGQTHQEPVQHNTPLHITHITITADRAPNEMIGNKDE